MAVFKKAPFLEILFVIAFVATLASVVQQWHRRAESWESYAAVNECVIEYENPVFWGQDKWVCADGEVRWR